MARTLLRCSNCMKGRSICVFSKLIFKVKDGQERYEIPEYNCLIGNEDNYNIYPRSEYKGDYMVWTEHEPPDYSPAPFRFANKMYQFESLSHHNVTGDEYDANRHDYSPMFHLVDYNAPINQTGILAEDEPGEIVGTNEFFLTSNRWYSDRYGEPKKVLGRSRVDFCFGLYGMVDIKNRCIVHKSMRNYCYNIKEWQNYTNVGAQNINKKINIFTDFEKAEEFCSSRIENENILGRILEALLYIKDGEYINLRSFLKSNDIPYTVMNDIVSRIATNNPKKIHRTSSGRRYNVEKVKSLYMALRNKKIPISSRMRRIYMANIVNFILNDYEGLGKIDLDKVSAYKFSTEDRYWFAIQIIANALYADNLIDSLEILPRWFKELFVAHTKLEVPEEKDPNLCQPPVESIRKILGILPEQDDIYCDFKDILTVLKSITSTELTYIWKYWVKAHSKSNSRIFWNFIQELSNGVDTYSICSTTSRESIPNFADLILSLMEDNESFTLKSKSKKNPLYWEEDDKHTVKSIQQEYYEDLKEEYLVDVENDRMRIVNTLVDDEYLHLPRIGDINVSN